MESVIFPQELARLHRRGGFKQSLRLSSHHQFNILDMKNIAIFFALVFLYLFSCQIKEKPTMVAPVKSTEIIYCHRQGPCLPLTRREIMIDPDNLAISDGWEWITMPRDTQYFEPLDLNQATSQEAVEQFFRLFNLISREFLSYPEERVDSTVAFFDREYFFLGATFKEEYRGVLEVDGKRFPVLLQNLGSIRNFEGFHRNRAILSEEGENTVIVFPAYPDFRIQVPSSELKRFQWRYGAWW